MKGGLAAAIAALASPEPATVSVDRNRYIVRGADEADPVTLRAIAREIAEQGKIRKASDAKIDEAVRDPLIWLQKYTMTLDRHWVEAGASSPYRPFPHKPYFRPIADLFAREPVLFLEKSRDMMASWFFVGLFMHSCMTVGGREVLVQSQKERKAFELIDYAKILYEQSDPRIRERYPVVKPVWDQADGYLELENGSRMIGIPGGAEQIRSYHPWALMGDEVAFQVEAGESYNNAIAACQKIVELSTAGPGWFCDVTTDQI